MAYEPRGDYGGDRGNRGIGQDQDGQIKVRGRSKFAFGRNAFENADANFHAGPVTDYSATLLHWQRNRVPNYKGSYIGESERPSASYIVDVSCAGRPSGTLN